MKSLRLDPQEEREREALLLSSLREMDVEYAESRGTRDNVRSAYGRSVRKRSGRSSVFVDGLVFGLTLGAVPAAGVFAAVYFGGIWRATGPLFTLGLVALLVLLTWAFKCLFDLIARIFR